MTSISTTKNMNPTPTSAVTSRLALSASDARTEDVRASPIGYVSAAVRRSERIYTAI